MKNLLVSILTLMALFASLGCSKPAPTSVKFSLDRPFALQVNQTGVCSDIQGFSVRFDKVASDSRCPVNVKCITAGKAEVILTLTKVGESQTVTLPFTLPNGTSNVMEFKGQTLRVVGVSPFKFKDKEIKPEEYSVMLTVIQTPPPAPKVKLGEDFTLSVGETIISEDDIMYRMRFDSVLSDSRCSEGVNCIWAGRVDAVFSLLNGDQIQQVTLATGDLSQGGKGEASFGAYTLKIKDIAPVKKQGPPIPQKEYMATLVLTK